jgi:thioredoxin reductase
VNTVHHEYIVIGGGPAGIQLGYFFEKNKFDYAILEANAIAGSFFATYPRHRNLISINKVHTGIKDERTQFRWDWNSLINDKGILIKNFTEAYFPKAGTLVEYLNHFTADFDLKISYNTKVVKVKRENELFFITTRNTLYTCETLIVATGMFKPYIPPLKGIELAENYIDYDFDLKKYTNKKVLVIGKGNSGFETADSLIPIAAQIHIVSPSPVKMAWNTHHVGNLRAINNNFIDTDQLKSQNATIWGNIKSIERYRGQLKVRISHSDSGNRIFSHIYDHIICCTGFKADNSIFDEETLPKLCDREQFPKMTYEWESENIENLYYAGTLTQARDYKESSSAFIHGFRYNTKCLFNILALKKGISWPSRKINYNLSDLMEILMDRINSTSSLWHQFNFICDYIVLDKKDGTITYNFDVPVDYVFSGKTFDLKSSLLFYFTHDKPKDTSLHSNFSEVPALHPVFKHIAEGKITGEHHMLEDLEAEWFEETLYIKPLEEYIISVCEFQPQTTVSST